MEFGILVGSVDDIDLVVRAEELGYDFCWAPDSQLMYSNPFAGSRARRSANPHHSARYGSCGRGPAPCTDRHNP